MGIRRASVIAASTAIALTALIGVGTTAAAATSNYAPKLTFPMTITTPAGKIVLHKVPTRIISLSPTATEILYAIGAGRQVVAVDKDSNYPRTGLPKTRFDAFSPNVEQLVAMRPSLVVLSFNPSGLTAQLAAAGIPVMEQDAAATLRDTLLQITWLGDATGHYTRALAVGVADRSQIQRDVAKVPVHHRALSVYFELDPTLYSVTSQTYVGQLLRSLGVTNIADAASSPLDGGYPQLTAEYLIKANPGMIFLADTVCCKQSYATVKVRAGFSLIAAVKNKRVVGLNDDVASRWGPRVSLLMNALTAAVLRAYKA